MAKRQPRSFTPPKKSSRRTSSQPAAKGRGAAQREEPEFDDEEEEKPERPGLAIEDVLILITTIGLVIGIFVGMYALGTHYKAGMFKGSYKEPATGDVQDPGTARTGN